MEYRGDGLKKKLLFGISFFVHWVYECFVLWRFIVLVRAPDSKEDDVFNLGYNLCSNLVPMMLMGHVGTNWGCHGRLLNASFDYLKATRGGNKATK